MSEELRGAPRRPAEPPSLSAALRSSSAPSGAPWVPPGALRSSAKVHGPLRSCFKPSRASQVPPRALRGFAE
eukprot:15456309-Alexandrium_andersonii.AAC.1